MKFKLNRGFVIKDRLGVAEQQTLHGGLRGEIIIGKNRFLKEVDGPYGKSWCTDFEEVLMREENIVPIGSYNWIFSKLFSIAMNDPIRTNLKVGDLNNDYQMRIGVSPQEYQHALYTAETNMNQTAPLIGGINISGNDFIFGFMIGDGGAREDNITAIAPDYKRRMLYHAIPFRVSDEPEKVWDNKYFGRFKDLQDTTSFYIKRFETTGTYPHIVHAWVTDNDQTFTPVDESVFASTSSVPIESYVEMLLRISDGEGLEYFKRTGVTPRINELGLVSGWYNPQKCDWESLHLVTHFTRSTMVLHSEKDFVEILYRLYSR